MGFSVTLTFRPQDEKNRPRTRRGRNGISRDLSFRPQDEKNRPKDEDEIVKDEIDSKDEKDFVLGIDFVLGLEKTVLGLENS